MTGSQVPERFSPTVTIITATLNALPLLKHTARSLLSQTHPRWQWIIVDGASTDGTLEWLNKLSNTHKACLCLSEPDSGIYEAFNKALPHVTGEWVIFLGAGDSFLSRYTTQHCVGLLADVAPNKTIAYGGVLFVDGIDDDDGRLCYERWQGLDGPWLTARPAIPCHQGIFHRASLFQNGFRFDTRYRIAADGELVIRELMASHGVDLGVAVTRMIGGGISSSRLNRLRLVKESISINRKIGIFWKRPMLQVAVLASNYLKHPVRKWSSGRRGMGS